MGNLTKKNSITLSPVILKEISTMTMNKELLSLVKSSKIINNWWKSRGNQHIMEDMDIMVDEELA
jgi:hypothetical protein